VQIYDRLFTELFGWRSKLDSLALDSIDEEEATWLERPFEESEILEVVRGMINDKASSPDGFTMAFFQAC
jgi:hypothetical protein